MNQRTRAGTDGTASLRPLLSELLPFVHRVLAFEEAISTLAVLWKRRVLGNLLIRAVRVARVRRKRGLDAHPLSSDNHRRFMKKLAAELIGTFALVFAGTGAIVINEVSNGAVTHVGIALTFGLVVLAMIYAVGDISGAHLNPAVTLGFWVARRFAGKTVLPYILSQCAGAFLASGLLRLLFPGNRLLGATLPAGPAYQSFVLEVVLTAVLMFVILNVSTGAKEKGITAAIAVGAVIGLEALFAGPICGASMNPARSLSPAVVAGHWPHLWIYLTAPILGAMVAIGACRCVQADGCCTAKPQFSEA